MIKLILQISQIVIAAIIALLFTSCGFNGKTIDGSGNVTTQNRTVAGDFTSVDASNGLEVYIVQGSKNAVTVEADDNLQQHIKTEVKGTELSVYCDVNIGNAEAKRITITLSKIEAIEASGGCLVRSKTQLKGNDILLSASSGSNVEVTVDAQNVTSEASSGSSLKISGRTTDLKTDASSGSSLDAQSLVAKHVKADASSGSTTTVNATESLSADASSGSSVNYVTTPKKLSANENSGGSVSQE